MDDFLTTACGLSSACVHCWVRVRGRIESPRISAAFSMNDKLVRQYVCTIRISYILMYCITSYIVPVTGSDVNILDYSRTSGYNRNPVA